MTKEIPLTQGKVALVDDEDYDLVSAFKWCASHEKNNWYAVRNERGQDGKIRQVRLHRLIMHAPKGLEVDHKNGDGLDNRRENLRISTHSQNQANQFRRPPPSGGYRGVYFMEKGGSYHVKITHNGKRIYVGAFRSPEEAARAYDATESLLARTFQRS